MEPKEWLTNMPGYFPELFHDTPLNHNPLIGTNQIHTIGNVHDVLRFVQYAIVSSQHNELQLSDNETSGIYQIVDTCSDALHFETACRPDGGEPAEECEEAEREETS